MLLALLTFVATLQTPLPAPPMPVEPAPPPVTAPAPPPHTPPSNTEPEPEPAVEDDAVDDDPPVRTRQVCRYVDVSGQRFPVRTCRTVPVRSNDG